MSNESNSIFSIKFTKKEVFWGLLVCLIYTSINNFYLIKFMDYHGASLLDITSKFIYTLLILLCGLVLYKNGYKFLARFIFLHLALLLFPNYIIPFFARNLTFLDIGLRTSIMNFANILNLLSSVFEHFSFSYSIIIGYLNLNDRIKLNHLSFFKKHIKLVLIYCIIISFFIYYSGELSENTKILFSLFTNDITLKKLMYSIFLLLIILPSSNIIFKAVYRNGFINLRLIVLSFILIMYIFSSISGWLLDESLSGTAGVNISLIYILTFLLSIFAITLQNNIIENFFILSTLKYYLLIISIISTYILVAIKEYSVFNLYTIHAIVGTFFSLTLIYIYHIHYKKLSLKKIN